MGANIFPYTMYTVYTSLNKNGMKYHLGDTGKQEIIPVYEITCGDFILF